MTEIQQRLFALQDAGYRDFHAALMPTVDKALVIGVRMPALRALAKELKGTELAADFMAALPHKYYEENNLHAALIGHIRDFQPCLTALERFLPYVDNWATCDMMNPRALAKDKAALLERIRLWLQSGHTYTVRFGMEMLMNHFLEEDFREEYPALVASVQSEEYYVRMMQAWYFATALAKQYEAAVTYLEQRRLGAWVHNKTIQKARESFRVSQEQKEYLKSLKVSQ
ncbi:MAG: DNA alkylation repair protein [bacterium]|nr:DNA alkylation repair protein [bacterium]